MPSAPIAWSSISTPEVRWSEPPSEGEVPEAYLDTGLDGVTITPHRSSEADIRTIIIMSNVPSIAKWSFRREYP